ncbi:MAG: bacterial Ig-like domain-containing protein [Erysipelotrichales bacterium]|nr:bacterial Ig-like domain-containing protein [Erysipelotrichales bacterium]
MRKIEKEFLDQLDKSLNYDKSYIDIQDKIDVNKFIDKQEVKTKKTKIKLALASAFLLLIMIIPISIYFASTSHVSEIIIANEADLVTEYQKNCNFIETGIIVDKKMDNGKIVRAAKEEVIVNYDSFNSKKAGIYEIFVYLKSNNTIKTSYKVNVTNDEITGIELKKSRITYYVGESINTKDLIIEKKLSNGNKIETKLTECTIDDSSYNSDQVGTYEIGVVLNSNNDFTLTYDVDVRPISELDISGKYGIVDEMYENTPPTILAMEIENDIAQIYYSEIVISSNVTLKKEVTDGNITISDSKHNQKMRYNPFTGIMTITGLMRGDPDMISFKLDEDDYLISLSGAFTSNDIKLVAVDGHLSSNSIQYLNNTYGGVYLDETMDVRVTSETIFTSDSVVVVGSKPIIDDKKPYLGIYYREEDGRVIVRIEEDVLYYTGGSKAYKYYLEQKDNGDIWIRTSKNEPILHYILEKDIIELWTADTLYEYSVKRVDTQIQAIVTIVATYGSHYQFVVTKGERFPIQVVSKTDITFYTIPGYRNTPIMEDVTFTNVTISNVYMSDISSRIYGEYNDYFYVTNSWTAGKDFMISSYWYFRIKNFEIVDSGWIGFSGHENGVSILALHKDSGEDEYVYFNWSEKKFTIGEEQLTYNATPFKDFDFVGNYIGEDGSERLISDRGMIGMVEKTEHSTTISYETIYIISLNDEEVMFLYIYQNDKDERELKYFTATKENGVWQFVFDGIKYTQVIE